MRGRDWWWWPCALPLPTRVAHFFLVHLALPALIEWKHEDH